MNKIAQIKLRRGFKEIYESKNVFFPYKTPLDLTEKEINFLLGVISSFNEDLFGAFESLDLHKSTPRQLFFHGHWKPIPGFTYERNFVVIELEFYEYIVYDPDSRKKIWQTIENYPTLLKKSLTSEFPFVRELAKKALED